MKHWIRVEEDVIRAETVEHTTDYTDEPQRCFSYDTTREHGWT